MNKIKITIFATILITSIFLSDTFAEDKNVIPIEYIKIGINPKKIDGATFGDYFHRMVDGTAVAIGSLEIFVDSSNLTYKKIFDEVGKQIEQIDNKYEDFYTIESVSYSVPNEVVKGTKDFFIYIKLKAIGNYKFRISTYIDGLKVSYNSEYEIPVNITVIKK